MDNLKWTRSINNSECANPFYSAQRQLSAQHTTITVFIYVYSWYPTANFLYTDIGGISWLSRHAIFTKKSLLSSPKNVTSDTRMWSITLEQECDFVYWTAFYLVAIRGVRGKSRENLTPISGISFNLDTWSPLGCHCRAGRWTQHYHQGNQYDRDKWQGQWSEGQDCDGKMARRS